MAGLSQVLSVLLALAALAGYLRRRRLLGPSWPSRPTIWFALGLVLALAVTCGPVSQYDRVRYWVWVSQSLALLLIVPLPLMAGRPVELAKATSRTAPRWPDPPSWLRSPLLGPAVMPLVCLVVLFGPVPGWAAGSVWVGWLVHLLLLVIGSIIVLPLVRADERASSLAVGAAIGIGFVELLVDAIPGIVLRLSTHPVSGFFSHRHSSVGAPPWLHDQQIGGGILWCVAELLDLPFLLLVFRQWVRADSREAAAIDAELDAQAAQAADPNEGGQPWFVNDPRLRDRLR